MPGDGVARMTRADAISLVGNRWPFRLQRTAAGEFVEICEPLTPATLVDVLVALDVIQIDPDSEQAPHADFGEWQSFDELMMALMFIGVERKQ